MFLAERRNKNKTVLDWADLESAVTQKRRLPKLSSVAQATFDIATARYGDKHWAHIHERLVAIGTSSHIELAYLHHSPGQALDQAQLEGNKAFAMPASGGRTTYKVCQTARGHFLNRWLPFNATDRPSRSRFRGWMWAWGSGGMYQRGMGPMLPDCGVASLALTPADMIAKVAASGVHVCDEWKKLAVRLLESLGDWRQTFPDVRFKFKSYGYVRESGDLDHITLRNSPIYGPVTTVLVPYSLHVRLRRPCEETDGIFAPVDDLVISVIPQPAVLGFGPQAMYALSRRQPGSDAPSPWPKDEIPDRLVTTSLSDVMHLAREFSAASVYIPAL